jgi:hypothetical protein
VPYCAIILAIRGNGDVKGSMLGMGWKTDTHLGKEFRDLAVDIVG